MTHTPGPHIENELLPDMLPLIYYEVDDENETCTILGDGQIYIGKIDSIDGYNKEITESILHRVNTHAALVEACKTTMAIFRFLRDNESEVWDIMTKNAPHLLTVWDHNKKALALAEGKEKS